MIKSTIAPIVAVIALILQGIFDIELGDDVQSEIIEIIINIVLGVTALYGIVKFNITRIAKKRKEKNRKQI